MLQERISMFWILTEYFVYTFLFLPAISLIKAKCDIKVKDTDFKKEIYSLHFGDWPTMLHGETLLFFLQNLQYF